MKNSLSFENWISLLICLSAIWSPRLRLLGFLCGADTKVFFLIINVLLIFASFVTWPINNIFTITLYIWPQIRHWFICPSSIFSCWLVGTSSDHSKLFFHIIVYQFSLNSDKSGFWPIYMLVDYHGGIYIFRPCRWFLYFSSGPP